MTRPHRKQGLDPHTAAVDHREQACGKPVARDAEARERVPALLSVLPAPVNLTPASPSTPLTRKGPHIIYNLEVQLRCIATVNTVNSTIHYTHYAFLIGAICTPATELYMIRRNAASAPALYVDGTTRYRPGCSARGSITTPAIASEYGPDVATCRPSAAPAPAGGLKSVRLSASEGDGAASCRRKRTCAADGAGTCSSYVGFVA